MAHPASYGRNHPCLDRPRAGGRFTADPSSPPKRERRSKPPKATDLDDIRKLRRFAMHAAEGLDAMLMIAPDPDGDFTLRPRRKSPPPDHRRLLRPNESVLDGLNAVTELLIRLMDKEREIDGPAESDEDLDSQEAEDELDRRIAEELDRIAARKRAGGGAGAASA